MNRRILLIDTDPDFRDTLIQQLGRYRFDVVVQVGADEAIADAVNSPPALILVAVDEPDKVGFKVFQRFKKGALSKISLIITTRTVTPESIAKHRALKIHADEYLDKRTMGRDELLGKIDNLIGLGDTVDDDLDIPVEVDDIPLGDGDMVLEETVGDDDGGKTVAMADDRLDQIVSAETDAAFDALLGGFGDDAPKLDHGIDPPTDSERSRHEKPTSPPPMDDDDESSRLVAPIVVEEAAVPAPILDSKRLDVDEAEAFDTFSRESIRPPLDHMASKELMLSAEAVAQHKPQASEPAMIVNQRYESSPAIMLDSDDLEEDSGGVPEPVPHPNVREREIEDPLPPVVAPAPEPEPVPKFIDAPTMTETRTRSPAVVDLGLDEIAADAESEQSGVYDRRSLRKIGELERQIAQLKTELDRQRATEGSTRGSRASEFVNLRQQLSAVAEEAKRAKAELEARTRDAADSEERMRQVQQARMALEAKTVELEQRLAADGSRVTSLESRERTVAAQLASAQQDLEHKVQALAAAESARVQLDRDLTTERATRAASASDAERALRVEREQMIARHQGELGTLRMEHAGATAMALEKQRQEHAAAQTVAIQAVRAEHDAALEVSRQQLEALRQQHEAALDAARREQAAALDAARHEQAAALEATRQDAAAELAIAVEAARQEVATEADQAVTQLEAQHAGDVAQLRDDHVAALARLTEERDAAIARGARERDEAVARGRTEHASALERVQAEHASVLENLRGDQASRLEHLQGEHGSAMAHMQSVHASAMAQLKVDHETAQEQYAETLTRLQAEHEAAVQRAREEARAEAAVAVVANERAVAEVTGELERSRAELANIESAHADALAHQAKQHAGELIEQANQHAAAMTERELELATARQDEAIAHTAALAELKVELDRQAQLHGIKLDGAKKELDDVLQLHEQSKGQLLADQDRIAGEQAAAHQAELAKLAQQRTALEIDLQRTQGEHRAVIDRSAAQHRDELAQQKELADREIAEYRSTLVAAKRTMEETAARHQAEREAQDQTHSQAIAEQKAVHERAMAVANGEVIKVKAFGDAEHNRAMAAKDADHAKALKDVTSESTRTIKDLTVERDELQRGLAAARDTIKRSESELASAVQTIADRNAELRSHTAAITERDQRIAELRKEIESLETENSSYQEQVLRAYQKIKADEAKSARAKKAMAIALTVLDDEGNPKVEPT